MPILAAKTTQLNAAYNFAPVLCLVAGDLSSYPVTVDAGTDTFTATGHDFVNGTPIQFVNSGGGLPGGLLADTNYFVINAAVNTFQVATTIGGAVVDVTSVGSGTHTVIEQEMGDEDDSTSLINQYPDGAIAWDVMVRHEVDYQGASRISFSWGSATPNLTNNGADIPTATATIIPVTGEITFRYVVLLRGGTTTLGDSTGAIEVCQDVSGNITLQGYNFSFAPQLR